MNANVKKFLETNALTEAENGHWFDFYEDLNLSGLSVEEAQECLQVLEAVGLTPNQSARKVYIIKYLMDSLNNYFDQTGNTKVMFSHLYTDCSMTGYSMSELATIVKSNAHTLNVIVHDNTDPAFIVLEDSI